MQNLITVDEENKVFHLHNKQISYLFSVEQGATLAHLYFGKRIRKYHGQLKYPRLLRGFSGNLADVPGREFSRDTLPEEYSSAGEMDYRTPATVLYQKNGSNSILLRYKSYEIVAGKPKLNGLPHSWVKDEDEAQTLIVTLEDQLTQVEYQLFYTIFRDLPVISRAVKIINSGEEVVHLRKAASMQIDFGNEDFEAITLPGAHANERHLQRSKIDQGIRVYGSHRGASSHQMNPFLALVRPNTDEFAGDAYGFTFVYSGNHMFELEKDQINQIRLNIGINDFNFDWKLEPNEDFQTPEVLMTYSPNGINQMSQTFHQVIFDHIIRSKFKNKVRPILVNNWEATYFDFNEKKLQAIVDQAKDLGIEMFVLDDGWFGHRDADNSSLGDWFVDQRKFPTGLSHFIDYVHNQGLKFGIWFEPEMISYDSELYKKHPDYLMHVPNRIPNPDRHQYVLDLGRKEVRQNIFDQMVKILDQNQIDYIKWNMNRHISDIYEADLTPDEQGEAYHRYILGLYDLLEKLTTRYPNILFEGCSGGGGRFDAGMAYYTPQIWASDNSDAIARLKIQYGTSLVYPQSMMTSHVSVCPNEQNGRVTPLATRGAVAMWGDLGYELDLTKLNDDEKEEVKKQITLYKQIRKLTQFGTLYRLKSPFNSNQTAWEVVSSDKRDVILTVVNILSSAQPSFTKPKLAGLNPEYDYKNIATNEIIGGDELMDTGIYDEVAHQDFVAKMYHFKAVN